jgi:hypothetical protein
MEPPELEPESMNRSAAGYGGIARIEVDGHDAEGIGDVEGLPYRAGILEVDGLGHALIVAEATRAGIGERRDPSADKH